MFQVSVSSKQFRYFTPNREHLLATSLQGNLPYISCEQFSLDFFHFDISPSIPICINLSVFYLRAVLLYISLISYFVPSQELTTFGKLCPYLFLSPTHLALFCSHISSRVSYFTISSDVPLTLLILPHLFSLCLIVVLWTFKLILPFRKLIDEYLLLLPSNVLCCVPFFRLGP